MSARLDSLQFAGGKTINWGSDYFATAGDVKVDRSAITNAGVSWSDATTSAKIRIDGEDYDLKLTMNSGGTYDFSLESGDGEITGTLSFNALGEAVIDSVSSGGEEISDKMALLLNEQDGVVRAGSTALEFSRTASVPQVGGGTVTVEQRGNSVDITTASDNGNYRIDGTRLDFYREAQINVDGVGITLRSNMTISSMITEANNALADKGIKMSYDSRTDRFAFESTTVGGASFSASGQALEAFGFAESSPGIYSAAAGTKAEIRVTINGITDTIQSDTNNFTLGDATITVNNTTAATDEPITITLKRDASDALAKIKTFIDAYNSIIKRIESLVRERKSPNEVSYGPLTAEEKSTMSDKQVEEWEAIARKGILRNDAGLQNLATNLRRELYAAIDATGLSPQEIGITTGRFDSGTGGQIQLDEEKLLAALEEDPERVADIFAGTTGNRGLLWRMNDHMGAFTSRIQPRTLKSLEESIKKANEQMTRMQERMYKEEDRLYKQFAAMETALSKMQSQGDWFNAMLGNTQK